MTPQPKELCLALMHVDTEDHVVNTLRKAGYWEDRQVWRLYGDTENNYSPIGNQQSRPEAALVEKIVNAVDARLLNACLVARIDPESSAAPQNIRAAVARFFEDGHGTTSRAGRVQEWTRTQRAEVATGIALVATGITPSTGGRNPSLTVSDQGEGQTPDKMPDTFLSLDRKNKQRIPFVQGKFNMGGTGVLKFCGRHNLQLIISRRNPAIVAQAAHTPADLQWGFTVVRREDPEAGLRNSVYSYLAPIGSDRSPRQGGVLRFSSQTFPLFPIGREPYVRPVECGSMVKLYEYSLTGAKTHILRKDGLLNRIDLLLPEIALPIRLHECREGYRGHEASFDTTLSGLSVRLQDDRGDNIEERFPSSSPIKAAGQAMTATIYAFKRGRAETYRGNEGVIFTLNGQTHGYLTKDFFTRKDAGRLNYIADSILVIVDCTEFSIRAREDFFMNSRDRLSGGPLRVEIESALEELLRHNEPLRELRERRRREDVAEKLDDSKPLEDILEKVLRQSPTLTSLFLFGNRLSNPFKLSSVTNIDKSFKGRRHPTYFRLKDVPGGGPLTKQCAANSRARVTFETDAENDYFGRRVDPGEFSLSLARQGQDVAVDNYVGPNLQDGIATLSIRLPQGVQVGEVLSFNARVADATCLQPFKSAFTIVVGPPTLPPKPTPRTKTRPPRRGEQKPTGIALPNIVEVHEPDWPQYAFDKETALRIKISEADGQQDRDVYDFFINMDNLYLNTELKQQSGDVSTTRARFKYGLVLVGMALLHDHEQRGGQAKRQAGSGDVAPQDADVEGEIARVTRAIAPILLPVIKALGELDPDDPELTDGSGEAS